MCWQELTDTTTASHSIVDSRQEAMHHGLANGVSLPVQEPSMDEIIVESVIQEYEPNRGINVDDDETQHGCHHQLLTIHCDRSHDSLELWESVNDIEQMD